MDMSVIIFLTVACILVGNGHDTMQVYRKAIHVHTVHFKDYFHTYLQFCVVFKESNLLSRLERLYMPNGEVLINSLIMFIYKYIILYLVNIMLWY